MSYLSSTTNTSQLTTPDNITGYVKLDKNNLPILTATNSYDDFTYIGSLEKVPYDNIANALFQYHCECTAVYEKLLIAQHKDRTVVFAIMRDIIDYLKINGWPTDYGTVVTAQRAT